ncbi:tetraspanin-18B isoform X1 [Chironomus tepperi]|uniref:tetraspanin-18B isoform X1 n=1 Tax=Chironomus tepperi TaxID=113505 RepID=UPI00391F37EE
MGQGDVGSCCAKYILCMFNFVFFILGSLVLGLGLWLRFDKDSILALMKNVNSEHIDRFTEPQLVDQTVYIFIVIGALMFVLGFLGYCGALRESQCLLSLYGVCLIILLVLEIVLFVFAVAYQDVVKDETESFLKTTIKEYKSSGKEKDGVSLMWNQLMAQFQCCGVNSYSDFETSPFWLSNRGSRMVPEACCQLSDKTLITPSDLNCPYSPSDENSYYMRGCQTTLIDYLRANCNTIIGITGGLILVQLLAAFLAFCIS